MKFLGFIVGPERSGTTITAAYLSTHPDIYVINDPHFFNFFLQAVPSKFKQLQSENKLPSITDCSHLFTDYWLPELTHSINTTKQWYNRWDEFEGDPVSVNSFFASFDFLVARKNLSLSDFFHKFYLSLIPRQYLNSKKYFIVKLPDLGRMLRYLRIFYTDVPVVFNVRHPVLNIASIIIPNKDRGWSFEQIISWYKSFFSSDIVNNLLPNVYFTRYEDLMFTDHTKNGLDIMTKFGVTGNSISLDSDFNYPNKKVMRKTQGSLSLSRVTKSLELLTPEQFQIASDATLDIQNSFYSDLPLESIVDTVNKSLVA